MVVIGLVLFFHVFSVVFNLPLNMPPCFSSSVIRFGSWSLPLGKSWVSELWLTCNFWYFLHFIKARTCKGKSNKMHVLKGQMGGLLWPGVGWCTIRVAQFRRWYACDPTTGWYCCTLVLDPTVWLQWLIWSPCIMYLNRICFNQFPCTRVFLK